MLVREIEGGWEEAYKKGEGIDYLALSTLDFAQQAEVRTLGAAIAHFELSTFVSSSTER